MRAEPFPELGLGHAMAGDLPAFEQKHGDLEDVPLLEIGVLTDVQLDQGKVAAAQHPHDHVPHLVAEGTLGLADQREDGTVVGGAQEVVRSGAGPRRRKVMRPAPTMIDTIVSWTRRPVRSG